MQMLKRALWHLFAVELKDLWSRMFAGTMGMQQRANPDLARAFWPEIDDKVRRCLSGLFPGVPIEEENTSQWPPEGDVILLDLLDGVQTLLMGTPIFGVQFALVSGGAVQFAAVFHPTEMCLAGSGLYVAKFGEGAFVCSGTEATKLKVSEQAQLQNAVLVFDGPTRHVKKLWRQVIVDEPSRIRNWSAFCWHGTRLTKGASIPVSIDGIVGINNRPADHLPSVLLVEEAGGMVTNFDGSPWTLEKPENLVFSNGFLHRQIINALKALKENE